MAGGREFRLRTIFEGIGQQLVFAPVGSQDGFEQLADDPEVEITFELRSPPLARPRAAAPDARSGDGRSRSSSALAEAC
jgi:hypothetical protein